MRVIQKQVIKLKVKADANILMQLMENRQFHKNYSAYELKFFECHSAIQHGEVSRKPKLIKN